MGKTIAQINQKIRDGSAVVVTAEEIIDIVADRGVEAAAREVDVVTTGTFGPMCSSGAYLNVGHTSPKIKLGGGRVTLNDVEVYTGFAAVDLMIGATALQEDDPRNRVFPGGFEYGGGHLIQDLVAGEDVKLVATAYGTDCYPRRELETWIRLADVNEAVLFDPRNVYQNYNCAVNLSDKTIYTYMGILKANLGNANYCSAGQLSPLLNDPFYRTLGIGTHLFLGGGVGRVAWWGTQHNPDVPRHENGVPRSGAGTLALIGDLKEMSPEYLVGTSLRGYGASLSVGVGVPIPVLDEEVCRFTAVTDADITAPIVDYSEAYPHGRKETLGEVSYRELRTGRITVNGKETPTASLSSYPKAVKIAETLKRWIADGEFLLSEPVQPLPGAGEGYTFEPLNERPLD
ncbi:MAG: homocysteine biosynthesis protein [Planctomycetota bacterium]